MSQKLLIINGSPRKNKTSYSFGRTLKILAEEVGNTAELLHIIDYFDRRNEMDAAAEKIAQSDIVVLVAPLYVDTLPYPDIWFLENLQQYSDRHFAGKRFFAVAQCGFPDVTRCAPLLNMCRLFSQETGMRWCGGLGYGGGAMLNGALLENLGKRGEKITKGFAMALDAVLKGEPIPPEAQLLLTIRIPAVLLRPLAAVLNHMSKKAAHKCKTDIYRKAYLNGRPENH